MGGIDAMGAEEARYFEGKGVWYGFVGKTPAARKTIVNDVSSAGVEWIAVMVARQIFPVETRPLDDALVRALQDVNCRVVPWIFYAPGNADKTVTALFTACRVAKTRWCILDVEEEARGKGIDDLGEIISRLHALGLLVAVTSYGTPWTASNWTRWLPCLEADAGMPQIAGFANGRGERLVSQWLEKFSIVVVVIQPYIGKNVYSITYKEQLRLCPVPSGGLSTWRGSWLTANRAWPLLAALQIPGRS